LASSFSFWSKGVSIGIDLVQNHIRKQATENANNHEACKGWGYNLDSVHCLYLFMVRDNAGFH